jgi:hypothetical protein
MSDGTFFVNSDGLDVGRNGFEQKGNQIQDLALRINDLMNPARVNDAAGNDSAGQTFSQQYLDSVTKLHDGMVSWGQAGTGTSDAINSMSKSFRQTDQVVTDAVTQFGKSLVQLDQQIGSVLSSGGSGGGGGDNSSSGSVLRSSGADAAVAGGTTVPSGSVPRSDANANLAGVRVGTTVTPNTPANLTERMPSVPPTGGAMNSTVNPDSPRISGTGGPLTPALPSVHPGHSAATSGLPTHELLPRTIGEPLTPESGQYTMPREPAVPPKGDHS